MDAIAVDDRTDRPGPADGPPPVDDAPRWEVTLPGLTGGWRTAAGVGLAAVVAVGVVLRFWTESALWLDEALTVNIASQPLSHLHALLREDGAPPLYYVLLHFWMKGFGTSDGAVRALAGLFSVLTLPVAWLAGRRYGGRPVAWAVLVLLASAPFAIYYATEARMYSLVMLETACGMLALDRALRRPRWGNLAALAVVTAALLYTHYWALYLVATVGLWLLWRAWTGHGSDRRSVVKALVALGVGCVAFTPWLPTFVFQSVHTGNPWSAPSSYAAIGDAVTGFTDNQGALSGAVTNQGQLLALVYFVLAALAIFGAARDRWHVRLDLRTQRPTRPLAFVVVGTLALAVTGGLVAKSAFSPRYASVVFIPLLLLVATGTRTLADARLRNIVLVVAAVAGLTQSVENVWTQRTEAPAVAQVLAAHGRAGDVVAFCPDQVGPDVYRLVEPARYDLATFPRGTSPEFVDWINYTEVMHAGNPATFAAHLQVLSGGDHPIWLVWEPGYRELGTKCQQLELDTALADPPGWSAHQWVFSRPGHYYEPMELTEFAPPARPST